MADDVDFASELQTAANECAAIEAQRALAIVGEPDCIDCGQGISARRRKVAPFARRCLRCQQDHEENQR
jgi:RNA polymerase-binding transcription factor DksA